MADFWANPSIEPKRKFRWVVYTGIFEPWMAKKVTRPGYEVSSTEHQYLNHSFFYPGRIKWDEVNLTVADTSSPNYDATQSVYRALESAGYIFPDDPNARSTISKSRSVGVLQQVRIDELSPSGATVGRFILHNAWITKAALGDFDYSQNEIMDVSITLKYDYATFNLGS
ncbi:hypothetical protein OAT10_00435 [Luminiphilus sp.]|nr:hypothetical protein [Luminiphilus sp.]